MNEVTTYKNVRVPFEAEYNYCDVADEYYATEEQMKRNNMAMKDTYSSLQGSSRPICHNQAKYLYAKTS